MILDIPGDRQLTIAHVVLDFNGTLAVDGRLIPGIGEKINAHAEALDFHVITADTFGSVEKQLTGVHCARVVIPPGDQAEAKRDFLDTLGAEKSIAAGNGVNDAAMLNRAAVGIAVLGREGLAAAALGAADIVVSDIMDLFGYLDHPDRLRACLRR